MRKANKIWIGALLLLSACKPQELKMIGNLGNRVRVSTADGFVYAELKPADVEIFTNDGRMYTWYDKGRINSSQGSYSGKLLHGPYLAYYEANKQLKEQGNYRYGLKTGKWLVWRSNGFLKESQQWYKGTKNGKTLLFDSLGNVQQKLRFKQGRVPEQKPKLNLLKKVKKLFKKTPKPVAK